MTGNFLARDLMIDQICLLTRICNLSKTLSCIMNGQESRRTDFEEHGIVFNNIPHKSQSHDPSIHGPP